MSACCCPLLLAELAQSGYIAHFHVLVRSAAQVVPSTFAPDTLTTILESSPADSARYWRIHATCLPVFASMYSWLHSIWECLHAHAFLECPISLLDVDTHGCLAPCALRSSQFLLLSILRWWRTCFLGSLEYDCRLCGWDHFPFLLPSTLQSIHMDFPVCPPTYPRARKKVAPA